MGATYGGTLVFGYGFNVETAGDHPVWYPSELDVLPRATAIWFLSSPRGGPHFTGGTDKAVTDGGNQPGVPG